ncbi:ABC transporter permease [Actinopolymorpha pittospori]|jgi:peptide/nickel transport system permease protein|uniref:Peptide/nickel transport system permease protein n=1 Tax=Actinopolymorpha pittospori TaxID=648752 RepID=A0A927NAT3_9ACTN|nr:ABC transporter permease [Actinopolymorpha pittospori]MBE1612087.1 peptide/nickel transport system permease protein [Actinopolymorpha pittospori]
MLAFIVRRLLYMILTLFIISIVSFVLIQAPPGDALSAEIQRLRSIGNNVSQDQITALETRYGLKDPVLVKYGKWIGGFVKGDFGQSFTFRQPVGDLIWGRLGFSVMLAGGALIIGWLIAIPIGVYSATHRYSLPDYVITLLQFIGVAVPEFLLALVVLVFAARFLNADVGGLFSVKYQDAPWSFAKFVDFLKHLWIPLVVISASSTAWLTRVMRANLLDVLNQQYVQTARAKGVLERRVIWKHAVRNAIHPLIMALGTTLPVLISGEAIVSIVLNLPTTGPLFLQALLNQDMYLAATLLMFLSMLLIVGNLLADIALAWVDPRARSAE